MSRFKFRAAALVCAAVLSVPAFSASAGGVDLSDSNTSWFNLQWPPTTTTDVNQPTDPIFGQIWVAGVTEPAGQGAGISAEVGYGPASDAPSSPSWTWFAMAYNVDAGNNDEYMGSVTPTSTGTFNYTTRYSGDGGSTWFYADLNGRGYDPNNAGVMTVVPEPGSLSLALAGLALLARRRR